MALNEISKNSNMYEFVTHTWNPIRGRCPHDCSYCYVKQMAKRFGANEINLAEKEFSTPLGENKTIFVGSSCDMWADEIPEEWIYDTLRYCWKYPSNNYFFQSKNPKRMWELREHIPWDSILCATIETNRSYWQMGKSPSTETRAAYMAALSHYFPIMVTIEPVIDFDPGGLIDLIMVSRAYQVNIGADSGKNDLPEPSWIKVEKLITIMKELGLCVHQKKNLARLCKQSQ